MSVEYENKAASGSALIDMSDDLNDSRNWKTLHVAPGFHDQLMGEKDAEIDRLRFCWEASISKNAQITLQNVQLKQLIAELAEWCSQDLEAITSHGSEILQRAREANGE